MKASLRNLWIKFIYSSWSDSSISLFNSSKGFSFSILTSSISFKFSSLISLFFASSFFILYFFPKLIIVVVGLDNLGSKLLSVVHLLLVLPIIVLVPSMSLKVTLNLLIMLFVWLLTSPVVGGSLSIILKPVFDNKSCMFPETCLVVRFIPSDCIPSLKPVLVLSGGKLSIFSISSSVMKAFTALILVGFFMRSLNFSAWPWS